MRNSTDTSTRSAPVRPVTDSTPADASSSGAIEDTRQPCVDADTYAPDPVDETDDASADDTNVTADDEATPTSRSEPDSHTTVSMPDTTARGYDAVTRPGTTYDTDPT